MEKTFVLLPIGVPRWGHGEYGLPVCVVEGSWNTVEEAAQDLINTGRLEEIASFTVRSNGILDAGNGSTFELFEVPRL